MLRQDWSPKVRSGYVVLRAGRTGGLRYFVREREERRTVIWTTKLWRARVFRDFIDAWEARNRLLLPAGAQVHSIRNGVPSLHPV